MTRTFAPLQPVGPGSTNSSATVAIRLNGPNRDELYRKPVELASLLHQEMAISQF